MSYSSIIYSLLTLYDSKKAMDIKLLVPIMDAKAMLSFSALPR